MYSLAVSNVRKKFDFVKSPICINYIFKYIPNFLMAISLHQFFVLLVFLYLSFEINYIRVSPVAIDGLFVTTDGLFVATSVLSIEYYIMLNLLNLLLSFFNDAQLIVSFFIVSICRKMASKRKTSESVSVQQVLPMVFVL